MPSNDTTFRMRLERLKLELVVDMASPLPETLLTDPLRRLCHQADRPADAAEHGRPMEFRGCFGLLNSFA